MRHLLRHLDAVRELLARRPLGLITDVDGTISEIAPTPETAVVSPVCRQGLADLAERLELVAAISGRPAAAARAMVGVDGMVFVGNHGLERWRDGVVEYVGGAERYRAKVEAARDRLQALLTEDCILLEDKGVSLSIHYRLCSDSDRARDLILETIAASDLPSDLRVYQGKMVVELRPAIDITKGSAVESLVDTYGLASAMYLGDDITDTDAFAAMHRAGLKGLAIAVLGPASPRELQKGADFSLDSVRDVERFLKWLVAVAARPA